MIYFVSNSGNDINDGSINSPWQTLETAVNRVKPGDILYIRKGEYLLTDIVNFKKSGTEQSPILYSGYPGEEAVINAINVYFHNDTEKYPFKHNTGALFLYNTAFIEVRNIKVINSHGHGIAVRDSNNIIIDNCITENTLAPGISLWDTESTKTVCHHNKIIGNTVKRANTWDMLPEGQKRRRETPHEAISVAGACYFEVCNNHVYDCDKEGIDIKEVSHHGIVHHNHVHHVARQGIYVDAWFGSLSDIEIYENNVHDCVGAGIVVSVEQGELASDVKIYNNNVYENCGSGILFGIFGADRPRTRIDVYNNIVIKNGYGIGENDGLYYWITGGITLLSDNISDCKIYNNIVKNNCGFQIGYSEKYIKDGMDINFALKARKVEIFDNIIHEPKEIDYPIRTDYENSVLYSL